MSKNKETDKLELIYCVKCRKLVPIADYKRVMMKSSRPAITGACPHCGTNTYKIISKDKK